MSLMWKYNKDFWEYILPYFLLCSKRGLQRCLNDSSAARTVSTLPPFHEGPGFGVVSVQVPGPAASRCVRNLQITIKISSRAQHDFGGNGRDCDHWWWYHCHRWWRKRWVSDHKLEYVPSFRSLQMKSFYAFTISGISFALHFCFCSRKVGLNIRQHSSYLHGELSGEIFMLIPKLLYIKA